MAKINSVSGPISTEQLGITLMHEHFVFGYPGWQADTAAPPYEREVTLKRCLNAMSTLKAYGVKTVVDATPNDGGRDPQLLKQISETSGINVICATGLYFEAYGGSAYFRFRSDFADTTSEIYETFMKDITQGIGNTGIKAGVLKVATGNGAISAYEERVLKAAARTQKETGVPIITHTEAGTMGPEQADILISEGVDPKRIMIGHMCGNANLQYHVAVLQKGVYIAFDRLGIEIFLPDTLRRACLVGLIGIGFVDQIMLSQDYVPQFLGRPMVVPDFVLPLLSNWSHTHIFKNVIPDLKQAGITEDQVQTMLVGNPLRLFAGA